MALLEHVLLGKLRKWSRARGVSEMFYIVGGSIRDLLLGKNPKDIDIAVKGEALQMAGEFAAGTGARLVILSQEFQSARVVQAKQREHLDFSNLRAKSLEEDLKARDFTIDAIALPLLAKDLHAQLIDPCGGQTDLNNGVIRMIAEENLRNDPLRLLRAFRLKAALGFSIEQATAQAIKRHASLITGIAGERIFAELKGILTYSHSSHTVEAMAEAGMLSWIFSSSEGAHPSNIITWKHAQAAYYEVEKILNNLQKYFGDEDFLRVETYFKKATEQRLLLKLAVLLHDTEKPEAWDLIQKIAEKLKASRKEMAFLEQIISNYPSVQQLFESQGCTARTTLVRLVRQLSDCETLYALVVLKLAVTSGKDDMDNPLPMAAQHIIHLYHQEVLPRVNNPRVITGDDLMMEFAIRPSPLIGEILNNVDQAVLEGRISSRQEALSLVRKILSDKRIGYN